MTPHRPRWDLRVAALAAAVGAALAGCSDGGPPGNAVTPSSSSSSSSSPAASATASSSSAPSESVPVAAGAPVETSVVADGLPLPWSVVAAPGNGWFVSLRDEARVVHLAETGEATDVRAPGEDGRVPGVVPGGEGGLLGLAVSDDLLYAYTTTEVDGRTENAVLSLPLNGDAAAGFTLGEPTTVLSGIPGATTHNGGRLAFGPDQMLYVTTGDARDTSASQDPTSLGGKILRITPQGDPAPGNPDPASPVWSLGHRNVQGIGWDAQGRMFASEFGQNRLDELNLIVAGANYGWPEVEGAGGGEGLTDPILTWTPREASPSGLAVTSDAVYLAALRGERLWRAPLGTDGEQVVGAPTAYLTGEAGRLRDVLVEDDALLVLTNTGSGDDRLLRVALG